MATLTLSLSDYWPFTTSQITNPKTHNTIHHSSHATYSSGAVDNPVCVCVKLEPKRTGGCPYGFSSNPMYREHSKPHCFLSGLRCKKKEKSPNLPSTTKNHVFPQRNAKVHEPRERQTKQRQRRSASETSAGPRPGPRLGGQQQPVPRPRQRRVQRPGLATLTASLGFFGYVTHVLFQAAYFLGM